MKSMHRWMGSARAIWLALLLLLASPAMAAQAAAVLDAPESTAEAEPLPVEAAFALSSQMLAGGKGEDSVLVLDWAMPRGYYLYRDRFALVAVNAPEALAALQWSAGRQHLDPQFGNVTVFYDRARLRVPVKVSASLPETLELKVTFQGCLENSVCYPPTTRRLSFALPASLRRDVAGSGVPWQWWTMLLAAFAGGAVLNLMPCVLPVLSLKVLSVLQATDDPIGAKRRALAYTAGVLLSFATLGAMVLALRASGTVAGWGFHMQQPWVVAVLALVMLAVGLGLSGVVHFGTGLAGIGGHRVLDRGLRGDFLVGVLACVVASPCTAPFMGAALAYALASSQPAAALSVFLALGLGLASPFLVMAFVPATARWLPRPGAWMETLKQLLAFPMYATVVWLLWVLGKQRGVDAMAMALLAAMTLALGLWWFEKNRFASARHRVAAVAIAALSVLPLLTLATPPVRTTAGHVLPAGAERFSPARLAELRQKGTPVFVDVTADWCLTCKVNQTAVLGRDEFRMLLSRTGTVYLVADYTQPDPAIGALLKEQGAVGVPLYVSYNGNGRSTKLPSVLSLAAIARSLEGVGK
jgi:thiol:disulfide interchange protein